MANLNSLSKSLSPNAKRLGRGQGSGKAKTSGRGQKGQNARHKMSITHSHYEGGQRPLMKRLPYRRGKGNPKMSKKPIVIDLKKLPKGISGTIDIESLVKAGIITKSEAKNRGVKALGSIMEKGMDLKVDASKKVLGK
ncbi:50S ribosomal protein L15 [Candidatus Curtissbacteria bacterium]|nr:50S ribosomal protein L15 [Candidatus Curtissbacteria bacterium]